MEAAKTPFYENAEPPLTAEDVQNLVLISQDYNRGSRTTVYDFECDIRGEHDKLQYTLQYHDDGEGFTIHTEKMIFGSVCRSRSLAGWKAYLAGKRYITSSITKSQGQKALKN